MMKKCLSVILLVCLLCSFMACGESKENRDETIVKEDESDSSSDNFQEIVDPVIEETVSASEENKKMASMVKNGIVVTDLAQYIYDENGEITSTRELDINALNITADEVLTGTSANRHMQKKYTINGSSTEFESKLGVSHMSEKDDIENMDGFVKSVWKGMISPAKSEKYKVIEAVYADGKMKDIAQYEETFGKFKEMHDGEVESITVVRFFVPEEESNENGSISMGYVEYYLAEEQTQE